MANFSNLALTVNGIKALLRAQIGEKLTLSKIGLGSGSTTNGTNLTSLVTPKLIIPISEKEINEDSGYMTISAIMTNENITEGFYWRETGLFFEDSNGNDVLFAYACVTNNEYDYIPAYSDQRYLKYVRIADIVTGSADITIKETQGLLYVDTLTFESFKKEIKEAMENIESNSLTNKDEDGNQRQLVVNGTENNGKDAIYIVDTVNGEEVIFSIFGDHNLPPVVDNLESESTKLPLSANQGRILNEKISNVGIRFNETSETIQIYKDGIWQDWLTAGHDGIIVISGPKVILNSSDVSVGRDITGGWTPSGQFLATHNSTVTSECNNMISLNNVKHIDFTYSYIDISNEGPMTSNAKFTAYLLNENGDKIASSSTNSGKGNGTFSLSLNTSNLTGMYKIGYILDPYFNEIEHETWNEYQGARVSISKIALYTI